MTSRLWTIFRAFPQLVGCIPGLIKLLLILKAANDERLLQTRLKDDVNTIHNAFKAKDPAAINHLFNTP